MSIQTGVDDLFSYIEKLPRESILSLYADANRGPYAAKTVLHRFSEIDRQLIIRLAACGGSFPLVDIKSWFVRPKHYDIEKEFKRLVNLCVIERFVDSNPTTLVGSQDTNEIVITLTPPFLSAMTASLTSLQSSPWSEVVLESTPSSSSSSVHRPEETKSITSKDDETKGSNVKYPTTAPTLEDLEIFTQRRWESVLHYLVGSDENYDDPPDAVVLFLEQTGLMQEDRDYKKRHVDDQAPLVITSKGYEFMLQDVHVQVWIFILSYFERVLSRANEKFQRITEEALLFLICLSYCKVGCAYPAGVLSKEARVLMKDFSMFGLIYICKIDGVTLFYPTRMAVNLVIGSLNDSTTGRDPSYGGSSVSTSAATTRMLDAALSAPIPSKSHIAIIVQTNFQVVAYTSSPLFLSMLGLFCDLTNIRRLPNVIFYKITRESVKAAFKLGIKAKQILRFLRIHAHPRLRIGDQPLVPQNVEDQIILWDRERTRVRFQEVFLLQCQSHAEFLAVKQWAIDHDCFAWGAESKNKLLVYLESADLVMSYVRQWRTKEAQRSFEASSSIR